MPSANPTPHPLDAAARDELDALLDEYTAAVADMTRLELNLALVPAKQRGDAFRRAQAARLALLASVRGAEADTARLDALDALEDARVMLRDSDSGEENTLWWRMPTRLRERGYRNALDVPIRVALDAARAHPPIQETDADA